MHLVYLSIGSNLGDRLGNLRTAVSELNQLIEEGSLNCSGIYETAPIDCPPGSEPFLNAVLAFRSQAEPISLLNALQSIEAELGRPAERAINSPRPVDLDILLFGDLKIDSEQLVIPHPRMLERAFVLCPLAELNPDYEEAASMIDQSGVVRLSDTLLVE